MAVANRLTGVLPGDNSHFFSQSSSQWQVVANTEVSKCLCRSRDPYFDAPLGSSDGGGIRRFPSGLTPISELAPTGSIVTISPVGVRGHALVITIQPPSHIVCHLGPATTSLRDRHRRYALQLGVEGAGFGRQGVVSARRPALRIRLRPHGVRPSRTRTRNTA